MSRLVASAPSLGLDLRLPVGATARLPDDPAVVAWLAGWRRAVRGEVLQVDGRRLARYGAAARVRAGLTTVGDAPVAGEVSVLDHLAAASSPATARAVLATVPHLADRADLPAGVLSGGERRLLAWARAVLLRPRVVVLDRAATGLDADALAWATDRLRDWRRDGVVSLVRVGRLEEGIWAVDGRTAT